MATMADANSRRLYSWWWDSHISPKNSKWLQENLTDMDKNVKAMIKLIEEDADSFRKRAEMYYRKRPELMKLVEEFYRAYRALAERYDHATGALRQAQRTMAEAFPDQIPQMFTDESPSGSSGIDSEPQTSNMLHLKDALDESSHSRAMKGTGFFSEENDGNTGKEGLGQLNGEEASPQNYVTQSEENGRLKNQITSDAERGEKAQAEIDGLKGSISKLESDKETTFLRCQLSQEKIFSLETELSRTQDDLKKLNEEMLMNITKLKGVEEQCHLLEEGSQSLRLDLNFFKETAKSKQEELDMAQEENQRLKNQMTSESERADKAQAEVENLKDTISNLESDKETAFLQCQLSQESIASLEAELAHTQEYLKKLNGEMSSNINNLKSLEEQCHLLEEGSQSLQLDLNFFKESAKSKQEELDMTQEENQRLKNQMASESERADKAQAEVENLKGTISKLESDKEAVFLHDQLSQEKISSLEAELSRTQEHLKKLNEEMLLNIANLNSVEEQCHLLEEGNRSLQVELNFFKETSKSKQEEFDMMQEENQRLKNQMASESERADKAQAEVENLKGTISKLESDKEAVFLHYQLSQEKISSLDAELSRTQEHLKKLNEEMLLNIANLNSVEEQCHLLEEGNQSLQVELSLSKEMENTKQEELDMREDELGKLKISLEDEKQRSVQIEMACLSLEELHSRSQEEVRLLTLEVQSGAENLELTKVSLEEEVQHLKEENGVLKEENFSNSLKIMNLQAEISLLNESKGNLEGEVELYVEENGSLKEENFSCSMKVMNLQEEVSLLNESKKRLEDEVELHTEENKFLQKEIISVKEDRRDLELRYNEMTQQIGALSLNVESLKALVKELRDRNVELKELCKMHEEEKVVHLDNFKHLGKIREKNAVLESSMLNTSVQLEELREKVKTLEESCKALQDKVLIHIFDKAVLVSQIEAVAQNMEKMLEKNTLSENSLSDANIELEGLRVKLKSLEESCQSLHAKESNLLAENNTLVTQVKSTSRSLENSESRYAELECKSVNLEKERGHLLCQIIELQGSLKMEKEQHETLLQFSKCQMATLENQISLLHEKGQLGEKKLEAELHNVINSHLENFILKSCLHDMTEKGIFLSVECQKYLETSRCKEELILELEKESCKQRNSLTASSQHNEKLLDGVHQMMKMLNINEDTRSPDGLHFKLILHEIEDLMASILDAQYDKQHLVLEKSIILTILQQLKLDMTDLELGKNVLQRKLGVRYEEASVLKIEKQELLEINEQLRENVLACNRRGEMMNAEIEIMCQKLADLQEADSSLQGEMAKLLVENQSLSIKLYGFHQDNDKLEEENNVLLQEVITLEYLYLIFHSYGAERALDLQLLHNELDWEISSMNLKLVALEIENVTLKESFIDLEVCRQHMLILEDDVNTARSVCEKLNTQLETGKTLLMQKDMDLLEASHNFKALQDRNSELCRHIEQLVVDNDDAILVRAQLEKKIFTLLEDTSNRDNEIGFLGQVNETLSKELDQLHEETEELKNIEKHSMFELQAGADEIKSCEVEIATLLNETQIATINASVFEEKMLEVLLKCESLEISSAVQRQTLYEELTLRKVFENESNKKLVALLVENRELKEEVGAYMALVMSLCDDIASLEECIGSAKLHQLNHQEKQHAMIVALPHEKSDSGRNAGDSAIVSPGIFELQKLHAKINALKQVLMDTMNHFEQERVVSDASLQDALRKIDDLTSRGDLGQENSHMNKDLVLHMKKKQELGYLQDIDPENHIENFDQVVKDIQLDHVLSSLQHEDGSSSNAPSTIESAETKFEMELWENLDSNKAVTSDKSEYHQIEVAEEEKNEIPSSRLITKEIITRSHRDWGGNVSGRLSSDSQRLTVLQKSVKELKRNMETSELNDSPTNVEFDKIRAQLKEAEKVILHLTNINSKLTKKAEGFSTSSDSLGSSEQYGEIGNMSERKKVSERARRGSEKIGRLELELQKIQYILLKLKEEHDYKKARAAERSTTVVLKDYIYGRRVSPNKRKKVKWCSCVRPKTKD